MKATEQYFPVALFIMLYKVVINFEFVDESYSVTIQVKAIELRSVRAPWPRAKYFPIRPSYLVNKYIVLSCGTVYHAVQGGFKSVHECLQCYYSKNSSSVLSYSLEWKGTHLLA